MAATDGAMQLSMTVLHTLLHVIYVTNVHDVVEVYVAQGGRMNLSNRASQTEGERAGMTRRHEDETVSMEQANMTQQAAGNW